MNNVENIGQTFAPEDWHPFHLNNHLKDVQEKVNLGIMASVGYTLISPALAKRGIYLATTDTEGFQFYGGFGLVVASAFAGFRGLQAIKYTIPEMFEYRKVLRTIRERNLPTSGILFINRRIKNV